MKGSTKGIDLFNALTNSTDGVFPKFGIEENLSKLVSLSTDGAPAMTGKNIGVVKMIRDYRKTKTNSEWNLLGIHCIIHQFALTGKVEEDEVCNTFGIVMVVVLKVINAIKGKSSKVHREFDNFIKELSNDIDLANSYEIEESDLQHSFRSLLFISCKLILTKL